METSPELQKIAENLYELFLSGDTSVVERYVENQDGILVIGTDPHEWWGDYESIMGALKTQAGEMSEVGLKIVRDHEVLAYQEGTIGWFADRPRFEFPDGSEIEMRVTGVFEETVSGWKLMQWHASLGVANEEAVGRELTT